MRTLLLAGAAALTLAAAPFAVTAQEASPAAGATVTYTLTPDQVVVYDAWPPEKQAVYVAWPAPHQEYYWTLTSPQQDAFWLLSDEQRGQVYAMTPTQRTLAWQSIERQLAGAPTANEANAAVPPITETQVSSRVLPNGQTQQVIATNSSNYVPPPAASLNKDYPLCSATVQDSCQNRGEGGAPGKSRALGYWPGEPASESDTDNGG